MAPEPHPTAMSDVLLDNQQQEQESIDQGEVHRESDQDVPLTWIRARSGWQWINVAELWQHRDLLFHLTVRDIKVRYKQTVLGALWSILQPVLMAAIFTVVMSKMANVQTEPVPYPMFAFCGFLMWTFFARSVSTAAGSLVYSRALITKVYFPRLAVPFASVGAAIIDFLIALPIVWVMMAYYRWAPGWGMLLVPFFLLMVTLAALAVGTLMAALNVTYRDFRHTVPFIIQIWMFATPTIYMNLTPATAHHEAVVETAATDRSSAIAGSTSQNSQPSVDSSTGKLLRLNPMTGLVAGFRNSMLDRPVDWPLLAYSSVTIVLTFLGSCFYFRRVERRFADII